MASVPHFGFQQREEGRAKDPSWPAGPWVAAGAGFPGQAGGPVQRCQVSSRGPACPAPRDSTHPCSEAVTFWPRSSPTVHHSGGEGVLTPSPAPDAFPSPERGMASRPERQVRELGVAWRVVAAVPRQSQNEAPSGPASSGSGPAPEGACCNGPCVCTRVCICGHVCARWLKLRLQLLGLPGPKTLRF